MGFKIEKKELLYLFLGIGILFSWMFYVKDVVEPHLRNTNPFFAAIIFHIAVYLAIYILVLVLTTKKAALKISIISILLWIGFDIVDAPYIVSQSGILNTSVDYWFTTYDAAFYSIYKLFVPNLIVFGKSLLWIFVYIITPIILVLLSPIIAVGPKKLTKILSK